jgi:1-acyl-sn-glycerol-3-phosphate acyltransferase
VVVDGVARARPALFVANHISWLDIPVLRAVLDCAFVSKQEVRTWPVVGGLAAHAGTVFLERGTPAALARAADQMTWSLRQGRSVVIFPEGTTTDGRSVQRFHARLYQAAILACATVQAVALRYPDGVDGRESHAAAPFVGDMDLARHLWRLAGEDRLVARLHFCAPVAAAGPRRALAEHTRGLILHALAPARAATHATPQAGTGANRG